MSRVLILLLCTAVACGPDRSGRAQEPPSTSDTSAVIGQAAAAQPTAEPVAEPAPSPTLADTLPRPAEDPAAERASGLPRPRPTNADSLQRPDARRDPLVTPVRALYVNRWKSQGRRSMRHLIGIADSTEINALVLDLKDEFGLNYRSADATLRRNAGTAGMIPDLPALLDTLEAHGIRSIARLVVFKDSVAARVNPAHTIRTPTGAPWRDREGLTWVDPYDPAIQEYNIQIAEELARMGFDEIQFDYIRFPEPYRSLPRQIFPAATRGVSKAEALGDFLGRACPRIRAAGALCTADIFGLVTTVAAPLEIGQHWETLAPVTDVLLPMVYPSHYPRGVWGIDRPNAAPYDIVFRAIDRARERNEALGLSGERVRPYLQAFDLRGMSPSYGPAELEAQKRAVYDAGYDGWVLWEPGSRYDKYVPGLERETISRRKGSAAPPPAVTAPGPDSATAATPDSTR